MAKDSALNNALTNVHRAQVAEEVARATSERIILATHQFAGQAYFDSLVTQLAAHLHTDYAMLCELTVDDNRMDLLSLYRADDASVPTELQLDQSACQRVVESGDVAVSDSIRKHFPADADLRLLHAEASLSGPVPTTR